MTAARPYVELHIIPKGSPTVAALCDRSTRLPAGEAPCWRMTVPGPKRKFAGHLISQAGTVGGRPAGAIRLMSVFSTIPRGGSAKPSLGSLLFSTLSLTHVGRGLRETPIDAVHR